MVLGSDYRIKEQNFCSERSSNPSLLLRGQKQFTHSSKRLINYILLLLILGIVNFIEFDEFVIFILLIIECRNFNMQSKGMKISRISLSIPTTLTNIHESVCVSWLD